MRKFEYMLYQIYCKAEKAIMGTCSDVKACSSGFLRKKLSYQRPRAMYFTPNVGQATTDPARHHEAAPDASQRLKKAKGMLDDGLITDSEYQAIKARIVNEL